jgi:D-3-phosphoglycerate dehydrogenase
MAKYRVAVTDYDYENLDPERAVLDPIGAEIVENQAHTPEAVIAGVRGADAILTEYAPMTEAVMASLAGSGCKGIVRWGAGLDNVDIPAATRHGIQVCNVPDFGVDDISDHAIGLMLCAVRKLVPMCNSVQAGEWNVTAFKPIRSLKDSVLGVVGPGRSGLMVAGKARAFGMRVIAYHPNRGPEFFAEHGLEQVSLDDLCRRADVISLNLPLRPETRHIIGERELGLMQPHAIIVNTARGGVIDSEALARALRDGRIGGAALDVLDKEPPPPDHPLLGAPNCIITPHGAYFSERSYHNLKTLAAEEIARLLQGQPPRCPVNRIS